MRWFGWMVGALMAGVALAAPQADDRAGPGKVGVGYPHYDLEVLYADAKFETGLALANAKLEGAPDDVDLIWQKAKFLFDIGEMAPRDGTELDKIALYKELLAIVEHGLELDPGNAQLLFAKGVGLGRLSTTRGVLASLFALKDIEEHFLAAANSPYVYEDLKSQLHMPCDIYLTLGIFYRVVPDSWVVGMLAGTRGNLDTSYSWLQKADQCAPDRIRTVKEVGVTELCIGTTRGDAALLERGKQTLARAQGLPLEFPTDFLDAEHAKSLVADPSLACGYSRDGQQERDAAALE